jgi:hypothetical protein
MCALRGGEVGLSLTAQATYDRTFGQSSSAVYGGDIVASSLYGFGVSAAAGNVAQQGLEYLGGDRSSFDPQQVQVARGGFGILHRAISGISV